MLHGRLAEHRRSHGYWVCALVFVVELVGRAVGSTAFVALSGFPMAPAFTIAVAFAVAAAFVFAAPSTTVPAVSSSATTVDVTTTVCIGH
jgi:hypothetical protein